jgi:hypothetical protein
MPYTEKKSGRYVTRQRGIDLGLIRWEPEGDGSRASAHNLPLKGERGNFDSIIYTIAARRNLESATKPRGGTRARGTTASVDVSVGVDTRVASRDGKLRSCDHTSV